MVTAFPVLYCCALPEQPLHVTVVPHRRIKRDSFMWAGSRTWRVSLPCYSREENELQTKGWNLLKPRGTFSPGLKGSHTCYTFIFSFAFAKRLYQSFIVKGVKREWSLARDTKILRELPALHRPCVICDKSLNLLMLKCCSNDIIPCLTVLLWGLELKIWDAQF